MTVRCTFRIPVLSVVWGLLLLPVFAEDPVPVRIELRVSATDNIRTKTVNLFNQELLVIPGVALVDAKDANWDLLVLVDIINSADKKNVAQYYAASLLLADRRRTTDALTALGLTADQVTHLFKSSKLSSGLLFTEITICSPGRFESTLHNLLEAVDMHGIQVVRDEVALHNGPSPLAATQVPSPGLSATLASNPNPPTEVAPSASPTAPPVQAPSGQVTEIPIRQEFKLGDYPYKVLGYEAKDQTGSSTYGEHAEEGATFVVVRFKVRNDTKATQSVLADDFRLTDA